MSDYQWQYTITPASADINAEEAKEATDIRFARSAEVAGHSMQLPEADPYAWGTRKEGQSELDRRIEISRIVRMRRERAEATKTASSDEQVLGQATTELYGDMPPEKQLERAQQFAVDRHERVRRAEKPSPSFAPDASTYIPQPPEWRDSPERRAGGPVGQQPQQQSFGQAQVSFDHAVARQLESLAGFVRDATRRIEELECWREALVQE